MGAAAAKTALALDTAPDTRAARHGRTEDEASEPAPMGKMKTHSENKDYNGRLSRMAHKLAAKPGAGNDACSFSPIFDVRPSPRRLVKNRDFFKII